MSKPSRYEDFVPATYWLEARCADGSVQGTPAQGFTQHEAIVDGFRSLRLEGHDPQDVESITQQTCVGWPDDKATALGV